MIDPTPIVSALAAARATADVRRRREHIGDARVRLDALEAAVARLRRDVESLEVDLVERVRVAAQGDLFGGGRR